MNYNDWMLNTFNKFKNKYLLKRDLVILLQYVINKPYSYILGFHDNILTEIEEKKLQYLLCRRIKGEPIAYIIEEKEFWSLSLKISNNVFIPRNDTECLIEHALLLISNKSAKILDLGTGSGAIALALAIEYPNSQIIGVDCYNEALSIARFNANNLSIKNVTFVKSNWFNVLTSQKFDLIISNPPYIDKLDKNLKFGDISFEPKNALVSSNNGMYDIKLIIRKSRNYLINNGWLIIEHGWLQGEFVRQIFKQCKYVDICTYHDYAGNERLTIGRWQLSIG
uniref:Release factor glutamine methyltransferase n=1 Tax=Candidatus Aschnera chinzeii TaxID=1485666 RepID=A0AAT9G572_9ENTR|nr:MAG: peptide chain release factor N(5)-glutamine methyltransferase [Candidatus Aschnera chinzeii]